MKALVLNSFFLIASIMSLSVIAEKHELEYPNAVNTLFVDSNEFENYNNLANKIGFDINTQYSYREYANIKRSQQVGIAGAYEFLLLSTGGNGWDYDAVERMNKEKCGWEMNYYSNHDLTVIHEVCHNDSRSSSFVRILKVGKGKLPTLNLQ